jgi:threonine-phosphate decarboxylase
MLPYDHGGDIYGGQEIRVDFSVNTNPLGMPESVIRAIREGTDQDVRYPDYQCRALRRALAQRYHVGEGKILCGNGAADLIFRICACLRPRRVLIPAPTFSEYGRSASLFGAEINEYPLREGGGFAVDSGFLAAITPGTDLVFLCNPNNPTGRLCDPALLEEIVLQCGENGTVLVVDECFIEFTDGKSILPLMAENPHLLILRAFTKLYAMAGLRLGYLLCADEALLDRIAAHGAQWSVSTVAQRAGLAALTETDWSEKTRRFISAQRSYLLEELTRLGLKAYPGEANYLLIRAPFPIRQPLLERGLMVRDGGTFTGLDETYFRVGVRTAAENQLLIDTLREVLHG